MEGKKSDEETKEMKKIIKNSEETMVEGWRGQPWIRRKSDEESKERKKVIGSPGYET